MPLFSPSFRPHDLPVRTSFQSSLNQRFKAAPLAVLRTAITSYLPFSFGILQWHPRRTHLEIRDTATLPCGNKRPSRCRPSCTLYKKSIRNQSFCSTVSLPHLRWAHATLSATCTAYFTAAFVAFDFTARLHLAFAVSRVKRNLFAVFLDHL